MVDRFAKHQGAGDEVTANKCLTADVDGLIEERLIFVLG
jgi:hypothetical protein